ncbi:MAG: DNA polymerase III subunit delta' [Desulfovermiculus sp.]
MAQRIAQTDVVSEPLPAFLPKPEGQERVVSFLHRLSASPPQVILLEGGSPDQRLGLGLYWAALLNCLDDNPPCLECSTCRQIQGRSYRDLYLFSGMEEAIKIDDVRTLRAGMGQSPGHGDMRVMIFHQAQEMTPSAANSLLKAMEEPQPGNAFVLLAPLRSWLLPTLVSRSLVLTLAWSEVSRQLPEDIRVWQQRMVDFWRTGRGLFQFTSQKGEVTRKVAQEVLTACQHSLLSAIQNERCRDQNSQGIGAPVWGGKESQEIAADSALHGSSDGGMAGFLAQNLGAEALFRLDLVLHKAHQALNLQTTPALVLDWVGVQGWSMVHGFGARE